MIPTVIPGLHAIHAVDAAGVHPLLLAVGSERYTPYAEHPPPAGTAHARERNTWDKANYRWQSFC